MYKGSFLFIPVLFLLSCSNTGSVKTTTGDSTKMAAVKDSQATAIASHQPAAVPPGGTPDFLALSKKAPEKMIGFLQEVPKTDSAGPYAYAEYYSDTVSFDLFYFPKQMAKAAVTFDDITKAESNNYAGFEIFVFVYPMKDPNKMADYHASNVSFPVSVKGYVRRGQAWQLLSTSKATNLKALNNFIIRTMYAVK